MIDVDRHIVIVGGGLAGSLLSIMLSRRGFTVTIVEKRADSRLGHVYGGRSINLALSLRGLKALDRVGLASSALDRAIPMRGREIHDSDGGVVFQPYSPRPEEYINSISRSGLNELLLDQAESTGVDVLFEHECTGVDFEAGSLAIQNLRSGQRDTVDDAVVFGADGAGSIVRQSMEAAGLTSTVSEFLEHGYKELTIPAGIGGEFRLDRVEALHIWPRHSFMLIALPNLDGSFTCTLFLALEGKESFRQMESVESIRTFFDREFPDAVQHMPDLVAEFRENPVSVLGTVRCLPWRVRDFSLLIGDAAHAIVPFYGQGMNCAFEDCLILDALLDEHASWEAVFDAFEAQRKPNADAIAHLALENFVEMRDKVADSRFNLRKKFELELARRFPEDYTPIYSHVTFSDIPYSKALKLGEYQAAELDAFLAGTDSIADVDWTEAADLVRKLLGARLREIGNNRQNDR